jgi:hypothetical protein
MGVTNRGRQYLLLADEESISLVRRGDAEAFAQGLARCRKLPSGAGQR